MRPIWRSQVRDVEIGSLQDGFLISAVATILVIRLQLWLTQYPQLGGGKLHIAHLLWGGLLMLIAIGLALSYVGRSLRMPAAILGGVGFGFFIDELGKFITSDNDYFFQPAAALIYLIFIGLYFATRQMQHRRGFSQREYLVNSVDALAEAARHDLDERERKRALALLDRADPDDALTAQVRGLLERIDALPTPEPGRATRAAHAVRARYFALIDRPWFTRVVAGLFSVWALGTMIQVIGLVLIAGFALGGGDAPVTVSGVGDEHVSFLNVASLASSLVSGALVILGLVRLRSGTRLEAYRWFNRALMVQIFIGQFFSFVESQFSAAIGLGFDVLLLITLRYMMRRERDLERRDYAARATSVGTAAPAVARPASSSAGSSP